MNNKNMSEGISMLDILSIISFLAQMKNMSDDEQQAIYDNKIIKAISTEIEKLHKENDIIAERLNKQNEYLYDIYILLSRRL